jgi:hypothetical protein
VWPRGVPASSVLELPSLGMSLGAQPTTNGFPPGQPTSVSQDLERSPGLATRLAQWAQGKRAGDWDHGDLPDLVGKE